ncbi:MAG: DUF1846 domain-containing protein [Clostridia bacterium]|nr:DUF1846 domain-containing protein [Clostridia bacterium]
MEIAFDNQKYLKIQKEKIEERIKMFDNKLYLEFGGKIFDDFNASRVLPGFSPDAKIKLLQEFKENLEIIFCINANNIQKNKIRADYGIGYDVELVRLIENIQKLDIDINSVVVTMYTGQEEVEKLKQTLNSKNIKVYIHGPTKGYPDDVETIVSEDGYGKNPYIETTKKLVVVTAPRPNSGKLGTCLSQLYYEHKKGIKAGYAKFETFPVWDLPLMHPVNVSYEAATADLADMNMIDSFHLEEYNVKAVNYNRDISAFPILKNILKRITGEDIYKSPTDMGVNMISQCIVNDDVAQRSAKMEIIRRYYAAVCDYKKGIGTETAVETIKKLMNNVGISINDREIVKYALDKAEKEKVNALAIILEDGRIITGKESELLSASSALLINTIKCLSGIPDDVFLLSPSALESIFKMKQKTSYKRNYCLNLPEVLIALSICEQNNPIIEKTLEALDKLRGLEAHSSYVVSTAEQKVLKSLGINLTCEPKLLGYEE